MRRLFAIVLAAASTFCSKPAVEEVASAGPMTVEVAEVRLEVMQASISGTGTVTPSPGTDWTIIAPEAGRIVEMPKREGDLVNAGDLLVKFEIPSLTSQIIASQSEVLQSGARLTTAKAGVTRMAGLVQHGIAPQRDLDDAQRELQEAEAAVRLAESGRAQADAMIARTLVHARFAGVVARRWHNPGDSVDANPADPVLRVIDPSRLEVTVAIPAAQLELITPGQTVKIFNPGDGKEIPGSVINRPLPGEGTAAAGDVRISLAAATPTASTPSTQSPLIAGMPIQVEITGDSRTNVLVVPSAAIFHEGDLIFVVVAGPDGKAHHKNVKTGIFTRDKTQILSGLVAGEKVVLSGADPIPDGAAITIGR